MNESTNTCFLGIDLGTSGVKAILIGADNQVVAQASAPLDVQRPAPLHSEQDPSDWLVATHAAVTALPPEMRARVVAIGLAGQMHGAVLLDAQNRVLRPAILWNDGRSHAECAALERDVPELGDITGNRAMPGFTAPKLAWIRRHEPDIFARVAKVLLPKDWLRFAISGAMVSDMSDAAGTLWLDTGMRQWSDIMLAATGLTRAHMPELAEGTEPSATLSAVVAAQWGMAAVPIAAGGGDNAAGAVGSGVARPGDTMMSIGTSGTIFHVSDHYRPNPESGVHSFCHALPGLWHHMSVMLSASSAIDWVARMTGFASTPDLFAAAEARDRISDGELFLPYLSGERTPHNDPHTTGMFYGLTHDTDRAALAQAALEGVAFAYADGVAAIEQSGVEIGSINVIGGGSRSHYWGHILAAATGKTLVYREGGDGGPAYGAARLARIMLGGAGSENALDAPPVTHNIVPDEMMAQLLSTKYAMFKKLYKNTRTVRGDISS